MEQQTETQTETKRVRSPAYEHRRSVANARQKLRLCAAAERTCAKLGLRTTVADVLKTAGMSRRSFYEHFTSLPQQIEAMHNAACEVVTRMRVPMAPWVQLARDPGRAHEIDADAAYSRALNILSGQASGYTLTDDELLEWARACQAEEPK